MLVSVIVAFERFFVAIFPLFIVLVAAEQKKIALTLFTINSSYGTFFFAFYTSHNFERAYTSKLYDFIVSVNSSLVYDLRFSALQIDG